MTSFYRSCINTSFDKLIKMCESYSRINTGGYTKTPVGGVDRSDGLVHHQHQTGWKADPVFKQLGTDYTGPMGLASHIRVPTRVNPNPLAGKASARDKVLYRRAGKDLTRGRGTFGQGCNKGDNTVSGELCVTNLPGGKEGRGQRPVINLKSLNSFVRVDHFKMEGLHTFH